MKRELTVAKTCIGTKDVLTFAQTDVGITPGSATGVTAKTADIILTSYNALAILLAAGVLFIYGIVLSPALGAVLMSLSTVIVAINAKLRKV